MHNSNPAKRVVTGQSRPTQAQSQPDSFKLHCHDIFKGGSQNHDSDESKSAEDPELENDNVNNSQIQQKISKNDQNDFSVLKQEPEAADCGEILIHEQRLDRTQIRQAHELFEWLAQNPGTFDQLKDYMIPLSLLKFTQTTPPNSKHSGEGIFNKHSKVEPNGLKQQRGDPIEAEEAQSSARLAQYDEAVQATGKEPQLDQNQMNLQPNTFEERQSTAQTCCVLCPKHGNQLPDGLACHESVQIQKPLSELGFNAETVLTRSIKTESFSNSDPFQTFLIPNKKVPDQRIQKVDQRSQISQKLQFCEKSIPDQKNLINKSDQILKQASEKSDQGEAKSDSGDDRSKTTSHKATYVQVENSKDMGKRLATEPQELLKEQQKQICTSWGEEMHSTKPCASVKVVGNPQLENSSKPHQQKSDSILPSAGGSAFRSYAHPQKIKPAAGFPSTVRAPARTQQNIGHIQTIDSRLLLNFKNQLNLQSLWSKQNLSMEFQNRERAQTGGFPLEVLAAQNRQKRTHDQALRAGMVELMNSRDSIYQQGAPGFHARTQSFDVQAQGRRKREQKAMEKKHSKHQNDDTLTESDASCRISQDDDAIPEEAEEEQEEENINIFKADLRIREDRQHQARTEASTAVHQTPNIRSSAQRTAKVKDVDDLECSDQMDFPTLQCHICCEAFKSAQSLGGHISRKHPRSSSQYLLKMKRREERGFDRKLLELAKQQHAEQFGPEAELNRVKIRRFKKDLRKKWEEGALHIDGFSPDQ